MRVQPASEEPAHGLLLRLARRYQRANVRDFAADFGLSWRAVRSGHHINEVARLAGFNCEQVADWTPAITPSSRKVRLHGEVLHLNDWSVARRRWCPECLRHDVEIASTTATRSSTAGGHRAWWDVLSLIACPDHGVQLLDRCSACGRNPGWTAGVEHCSCGAPLWASHAPAQSFGQDDYILSRLRRGPTAVAILDSIALHEAIRAMERLGIVADGRWRERKPHLSHLGSAQAREQGLGLAREWPSRFHDALDRILTKSPRRPVSAGLLSGYGWIYETWALALPAEGFGIALKNALRDHAVRNKVIPEHEKVMGIIPRPSVIDLTTAASVLGFGGRRMRRVADAYGLLAPGVRRGVAMPLDPARVALIKHRLEQSVSSKEVGRLLGAGMRTVRRLVQGVLLKPIGPESPKRYSPAAVADLLATLTKSIPMRRSAPASSISLAQAGRYFRVPIDAIVRLILEGSIRSCGRLAGPTSLNSIFVFRNDVQRLVERTDLMVEDAASQIGIHHESALGLVRLGLLRSTRRGPRGRHHIAKQDVADFQRRYVSGREIANRLGTTSRTARTRLEVYSVHAVAAPPKCRQIFYRRCDVSERVLRLARR